MGSSESDNSNNDDTFFRDLFLEEGARSAAVGGAIGGAVAGVIAGVFIGLFLCCCLRYAAGKDDEGPYTNRNSWFLIKIYVNYYCLKDEVIL